VHQTGPPTGFVVRGVARADLHCPGQIRIAIHQIQFAPLRPGEVETSRQHAIRQCPARQLIREVVRARLRPVLGVGHRLPVPDLVVPERLREENELVPLSLLTVVS
jgi:hypothetical protein